MERHTVFIVGGGPSLSTFNLSQLSDRHTICINQAALDVPNPDYLISCDYTFLDKVGRDKVTNLSCTKIFIANFIGNVVQDVDGRIVDTQHNLVYDLSPFDMIIKARNRSGLGGTFRDFRSGGSSGYCGFQLAVLLGYKEIILLGFDFDVQGRRTHYHSKYSTEVGLFKRRLDSYFKEFNIGLNQLKKDMSDTKVYTATHGKLESIIPYNNPL